MSWSLFKTNVLRKTNPNTNPSLNIDEVANVWAEEYDAAIKRGKDFINFESIEAGNLELMKTIFKVALLKGLATPPGVNFSLPNEFGNGVTAYWVGAQMRPFPIPLIPAPGSIQNIAVNSNVAVTPGTWPLYPPLKPARTREVIVNMFILAAVVHLFSVGGIIQTTSLYPSVPSPIPGPGVISWTGYLVPPAIPKVNPNFPSEDGSEPPIIEEPDGSDGFAISDTDQATDEADILNGDTDQATDEADILNGDTSLDNIINTTLPRDVINPLESEEIIRDFREQLEVGGTKCD